MGEIEQLQLGGDRYSYSSEMGTITHDALVVDLSFIANIATPVCLNLRESCYRFILLTGNTV